jgi:hypothetical protein
MDGRAGSTRGPDEIDLIFEQRASMIANISRTFAV